MSNIRFCSYLRFPPLQFQTLQLPACLTWCFLQVTCPPCLWEISCIQISERHGILQKTFTPWSSVVHKGLALTLQFFSCLRIPRHRISPGMVGTHPKYFFLTQKLNSCALFDWFFSISSHSHADLILWAVPYFPWRVDLLILLLFCRCSSEG